MTGQIVVTPDNFTFLDMRYLCPVQFHGRLFPSAENAFQAAKFTDPDIISRFQYISPDRAAYNGAVWRTTNRDWNRTQDSILYEILDSKFKNRQMNQLLHNIPKRCRIKMANRRHENHLGSCQCPKCRDRGLDLAGTAMTKLLAKTK